MVSSTEKENPFMDELKATAKKIAGRGRGILASDESNATTGKRLEPFGIENTEDVRYIEHCKHDPCLLDSCFPLLSNPL